MISVPWRRSWTCAGLLGASIACVGCHAPPPMQAPKTAQTAEPVWFVDTDSHGLHISGQNAYTAGRVLAFQQPPGPVYAAAFYPRDRVLDAVLPDGSVVGYELAGDELRERHRDTPSSRSAVAAVRFTRVPALLYVDRADLSTLTKIRDSPVVPESVYTTARVELDRSAYGFVAFAADEPDNAMLEGRYRAEGSSVVVTVGSADPVRLELSDTLAPPTIERDHVGSSVFYFRDEGFLCLTRNGWELHDTRGALVKWFPTGGVSPTRWGRPIHSNGLFYVLRTGYTGEMFILDIERGALVSAQKAK